MMDDGRFGTVVGWMRDAMKHEICMCRCCGMISAFGTAYDSSYRDTMIVVKW